MTLPAKAQSVWIIPQSFIYFRYQNRYRRKWYRASDSRFLWFGFFFTSRGAWCVHHSRVNIQLPLKCCFTELHKDDQSLTLYDEVFLKTRNLFGTYQKISKRNKEIPSLGLSSIFVGSCAKKTTNIGIVVIRQWSSYQTINPISEYDFYWRSWLTEWILEGDPEGVKQLKCT
jgi:hypothetical protein